MRKKFVKKLAGAVIAASMVAGSLAPQALVFADSRRVITLGADLSEERKAAILKYFGVSNNAVETIYVNNTDERNLLSSFVPLEVIGTRTLSCAYVNPTSSGGIQVKTANLTWVTSNMIASALSTSGVKNCEVIAACPIPVSGTGALAGVLKAYETAAGEVLNATRKEIAAQEIVTTGDIASTISQSISQTTSNPDAANMIGQNTATQIVNDIKLSVIEDAVEEYDTELISAIVDQAVSRAVTSLQAERDELVELSAKQKEELQKLAESIAAQQYNYDDVKDTLERVEQNVSTLSGSGDVNVNVNVNNNNTAEGGEATTGDVTAEGGDATAETGGTAQDGTTPELASDSILLGTDVSALGEDVITDATTKEAITPTEEAEDPLAGATDDMPFAIEMSDEGSFGNEGTESTPAEEQGGETIPEASGETFNTEDGDVSGEITYVDGSTEIAGANEVTEVDGSGTTEGTAGDELIYIGDGTAEENPTDEDNGDVYQIPDESVDSTVTDGTGEGETLPEDWTADEPAGDEAEAPKLAIGTADKTFNGFSVKLYTNQEVVPASGTVVLTDEEGSETRIDLSDSSSYGVLPCEDYDRLSSLGFEEGYEIHVLTTGRGFAGGSYHVTADVVFADADEDSKPVAGTERDMVSAEADLTFNGSGLTAAGSDFTAPTVVTLTSAYPEGTAYAEVASSDEYVAIPDIYTLGEGTGSVDIELEESGPATITVSYYNEAGESLGGDSLAIAAF